MPHTIKQRPGAARASFPAVSTANVTPPKLLTVVNKSIFDQLPDSAWLRESQLVRSSKRPNSTAPLPFSAPTLWRLVRKKRFPAPVKLSARVTAWKCGDVREWMAAQANMQGVKHG